MRPDEARMYYVQNFLNLAFAAAFSKGASQYAITMPYYNTE